MKKAKAAFLLFLLMAAFMSALVVLSGAIDELYGIGMAEWKLAFIPALICSLAGYIILYVQQNR